MPIKGNEEPVKVFFMRKDGMVIAEAVSMIQEFVLDDGFGYDQEFERTIIGDIPDCSSFTFTFVDETINPIIFKAIIRSYQNNWRKMHGLPKIRRRKRRKTWHR